jgi:hypothetical protein
LRYSDVRGILAEGMAMNEKVKQTNLNKSIIKVRQIAREWYKKEKNDALMCFSFICKKKN